MELTITFKEILELLKNENILVEYNGNEENIMKYLSFDKSNYKWCYMLCI